MSIAVGTLSNSAATGARVDVYAIYLRSRDRVSFCHVSRCPSVPTRSIISAKIFISNDCPTFQSREIL